MPISTRTLNAVMKQESEDTDIILLTLTHSSWKEPIRLSTHETQWIKNDKDTGTPLYGTVSRGNTYWYCPIQATIPNSSAEQAPEGKLVLQNVTREVSPYLKMIDQEYPKVLVEVVNSNTPDVVDMAFPDLDLSSATWDAMQVEVTLKSDIAATEPSPWLRFSLAYFPNLKA
jgi:hypothetical protein